METEWLTGAGAVLHGDDSGVFAFPEMAVQGVLALRRLEAKRRKLEFLLICRARLGPVVVYRECPRLGCSASNRVRLFCHT